MFSSITIVASVLATLVSAQSTTSAIASATISQSMPAMATAGFNPADVTSSMTNQWCLAQRNTCPQICGGIASTNTCDPTQLVYQCICQNGTAPDVTAFINTLPFFICQATFAQCSTEYAGTSSLSNCTTNEQCGSQNATALEFGSSSSSSAAASSTTAASSTMMSASTTAASSAAAATTSSKGVGAVVRNDVATGAFAAIFIAAFRLLL